MFCVFLDVRCCVNVVKPRLNELTHGQCHVTDDRSPENVRTPFIAEHSTRMPKKKPNLKNCDTNFRLSFFVNN